MAKTLWTQYGEKLVRIEADMYFERNRLGYDFQLEELQRAHRWCLNTAKIMLNTRGLVCVSNTFTKWGEMNRVRRYLRTATGGPTEPRSARGPPTISGSICLPVPETPRSTTISPASIPALVRAARGGGWMYESASTM